MATNKNAITRYHVLDTCFRNNGRKYFIEDLIEACNDRLHEVNPNIEGIKRRQLYEDIKFMESEAGYAAPIGRFTEGKKTYYRYRDLSFSINNQPLNATEIEQLNAALNIMQRFTGTPMFEWVKDVVMVLENKLGRINQQKDIIAFEGNPDLQGLPWMKPLFEAIINQQVLVISYKDFKSHEPYAVTFHPYYLKQYNTRWFVFGYNEDSPATQHPAPQWNLALDRIQDVKPARGRSYQVSSTDWEDFFYDMIGVTKFHQPVEQVLLRFSTDQAHYVETKPLHPTQKVKARHEHCVDFQIEVIPNIELEQLILSFGEKVEVLAPETVRETIKERIRQSFNRYSN